MKKYPLTQLPVVTVELEKSWINLDMDNGQAYLSPRSLLPPLLESLMMLIIIGMSQRNTP